MMPMPIVQALAAFVISLVRSNMSLQVEIVALRHQDPAAADLPQ